MPSDMKVSNTKRQIKCTFVLSVHEMHDFSAEKNKTGQKFDKEIRTKVGEKRNLPFHVCSLKLYSIEWKNVCHLILIIVIWYSNAKFFFAVALVLHVWLADTILSISVCVQFYTTGKKCMGIICVVILN